VQLLVGEVLLGPGEPGIVERKVVDGELLRVLDGEAIGVGVAGPGGPLRDVLVVVLGETVLRTLRNARLESNVADVDLGDALAHEFARAHRDEVGAVDRGGHRRRRPGERRVDGPEPVELFAVTRGDRDT